MTDDMLSDTDDTETPLPLDDEDPGDEHDGDSDNDSDAPHAGPAPVNAEHLRVTEALLFASAEPLSEKRIAARLPEDADVKGVLRVLRAQYAGRGVNLVKAGQGWAFRTADDLGPHLEREREVTRKLSRAAIETLAIIAYHQPVTKAEIEEVRGVSLSAGTFDTLCEAGWVKPRGRKESPGHPMLWGTTDGFLDHFGLASLRDLPGRKDLAAMGLLDSGPALDAYRARGDLGPPQAQSEGGGDGDRELPLEDDEADAPLDPDDGVGEADTADSSDPAPESESESQDDTPPW
jgi:segregation and condensation protein B